jgi:hypothetical protein
MCPIFEFAIVNWPACMMFTSFKILLSYPQMVNAQETPELGHRGYRARFRSSYTGGDLKPSFFGDLTIE